MNDCAALHGEAAKVHTKIIRDFAVVGHVEGGDVGVFANFNRAAAVMLAERIGRVNRGGANGFRGCHAHLRASEGQNHRHGDCGARARIEIGGKAENRARID